LSLLKACLESRPLRSGHKPDQINSIMKNDQISLNILTELQADSSIRNQDLADKIGLSPSPCLQRVRKLEKEKVITGYTAQINLSKIFDHVVVILEVSLKNNDIKSALSFEAYIRKNPMVIECNQVSGQFDYLVKFISRSIEHYMAESDKMLDHCEAIGSIKTHVAMKTIKEFTGFPIKHLMESYRE